MSLSDWIILLVVALWAIVGVVIARRRRKKGRGCCGDCSNCDGC